MVFSLSALWWKRIRGLWKLPDGRDWLRGKLGLVLMGGATLSISLIQFSVNGWSCVPPCYFSSVQLLSHVWIIATPRTAAHQASLSYTNSRNLLKLMSIELVMPSNHLIICCPLLLLPYIFPSIRVFSDESTLHIKWPKYWSFSFNISPSNEYLGLIFFKMDWLDLSAVQGTLKSLLQHHSSKASILKLSALSFLYSPSLTSIHDYWKNHSFD